MSQFELAAAAAAAASAASAAVAAAAAAEGPLVMVEGLEGSRSLCLPN